jgi:hypothetical protein
MPQRIIGVFPSLSRTTQPRLTLISFIANVRTRFVGPSTGHDMPLGSLGSIWISSPTVLMSYPLDRQLLHLSLSAAALKRLLKLNWNRPGSQVASTPKPRGDKRPSRNSPLLTRAPSRLKSLKVANAKAKVQQLTVLRNIKRLHQLYKRL